MTPAQRQYDLDLAASMQRMAVWIEPRSRKVSDTLKVAAVRISCWRLTCQMIRQCSLIRMGIKSSPRQHPRSKPGEG